MVRAFTVAEEMFFACALEVTNTISVGSSFGHAALKSFDYQLTKGHMRPSQGYTNEIHVYFPEGNAPDDGTRHASLASLLT